MRYIKPILTTVRTYPIETGLIFLALGISVVSFIPKAHVSEPRVQGATTIEPTPNQTNGWDDGKKPTLLVEVSGAVLHPDVYSVIPGTHMKEVIDMAGGLTNMADRLYVGRNYNLARLVGDQEKIYIPYTWDIKNGTFYEQKRVLEYLQPLYQSSPNGEHGIGQAPETTSGGGGSQTSSLQISINKARAQELDTLPGVGPATAQKIVDSRPYLTIEELVSRKVMNQSTFEKLKELIKL